MQSTAAQQDYMSYHVANFTSEENKPYPYVHLSTSGKRHPHDRGGDGGNKVRVWVQGAAHGNEPAGDEALLGLLGKFGAYPDWARSILDTTELVVMPRYNPDGVAYFQRTLATNYDPNRDHIKLAREQTRSIKRFFSDFNPHVVVDMHEYGAGTRYGRYVHASDGLFSAAKNLNIAPSIRNVSEALFAKNMGEAMVARGLRWEPYATGPSSTNASFQPRFEEAGTDGKIGRNAMGLTQAVTFLIEMRGIGIADQEFQRRTVAGITMARAVIETAAYHAAEVAAAVEGGRSAFIASTDPIVVTDNGVRQTRNYSMVEYETGAVTQVEIQWTSTTPAIANLTRSRPAAYIIPAAWSDLAERLRVGGVQVETMTERYEREVQVYNVLNATLERAYYEGAVRAAVVTNSTQRVVSLPPGSFRVSTRQKNAAIAFVALEPENIDSYASFNIVPVEEGDEYPIYREL